MNEKRKRDFAAIQQDLSKIGSDLRELVSDNATLRAQNEALYKRVSELEKERDEFKIIGSGLQGVVSSLELERVELRKRPTPETYTLTLKAIEAQCEATKKVQDELAIATKERDACKNALLSDWTENDAALTKAGIPEHEGGEVLTVITRIEMLIAQRDALRTKAVEALEILLASAHPNAVDNPAMFKAFVLARTALTALRGDNAGGEG